MARSEFLAGLHARFETPRQRIVDLIGQVCHTDVAGVRQIMRGYDNEVHRVDLDTGAVVFARIRRDDEGDFAQELWAMAKARDHGVPVPRVLGIGMVDDGSSIRPAMVIEQAAGRQLTEILPALEPYERRAVMIDLGRVLGRLHRIEAPGPWRAGPDGRWPDPDVVRTGFAAERRAERVQLEAAGLDAAEIELTLETLAISPDPPERDFVLCHGDVSPEHVFVDSDRQVSGLIDWGMWHGGSVLGELAQLTGTFSAEDQALVLTGHGDDPTNDELRRALAQVQVGQQIGHIAHHVIIGDQQGAADNVAVLRRALANL